MHYKILDYLVSNVFNKNKNTKNARKEQAWSGVNMCGNGKNWYKYNGKVIAGFKRA